MKKKRIYKNRKKYAYGGTPVKNYIETPATAMANHDIDVARSQFEGANSNLTKGIKIGGALLSQALGGQNISAAADKYQDYKTNKTNTLAIQGANNYAPIPVATSDYIPQGAVEVDMSNMQGAMEFAFGGSVPVEVEGQEVAETPNGNLIEFEGPNHEQGGVNVDLPGGTDIFSKRLRVKGKTLAQRKKIREKRLARIQKQLDASPSDAILKKSYERVSAANETEEASDQAYQDQVNAQMNPAPVEQPQEEFAFGGEVGDFLNENSGGLPSASETLGLAGTLYSGIKPMLNTLENRGTDTANVNEYADFGEDALAAIDKQKVFVTQQEAVKLQDLEGQRMAALKRGRNSARSANTQRALDINSTQAANTQAARINSQATKEMQAILGQQATAENLQDKFVMKGEQARDTADRMDKDNFNTQLSTNQVGLGRSIQEASKNLGKIASNDYERNLVNARSQNFMIDRNGNVTDKNGKKLNSAERKEYARELKGLQDEETSGVNNISPEEYAEFLEYKKLNK